MNRKYIDLRLQLFVLITLFFMLTINSASADMVKCQIGNDVWNYFDSNDEKQLQKCKAKPIVIVTSAGQKIQSTYSSPSANTIKTTVKSQPLTAAKDVKPSCGGSGGTVIHNGKVFHLDAAAICGRYSKKGGKITVAKRGKTHKVDAAFRKKIAAHVEKMAIKYNLEPEFIHAIISAESSYNPNAVSRSGAEGLMQLMPFTAERFGVTNSFDPYQNIEGGAKYLRILLDEFGSLELAAAGYNAGEGAVRKYNRSIPPYKETMAYVPKVKAFYEQYKKNQSLIAAN